MTITELLTDDGVRLHYEEQGSGRVSIIYLHWMGGSAGLWRELWDGVDSAEFHHIALDARGHGDSELKPSAFSIDRLARDVLHLADHLGLSRFAVVGHSFGGKVALRLAALAPARVARLVLLGAVGPGPVALDRHAVETVLQRAHQLPFVREFFRLWFQAWPRDAVDAALETFSCTPAWALRAVCENALWTDLSPDIPPLPHAALVMAGTQDPVYGPGYQRQAVLPFVPHARLVTIPACGHGLFLERPHEVARHCASFFSAAMASEWTQPATECERSARR